MQASAIQAIIPKARGMYAQHLTTAQYEELMRRRSVPELASILKNHPYFKNSLATLSTLDPHRGQIEELLGMDIFLKYKSLLRYDFSHTNFASYYLAELEMNEILKALRLLSTGQLGFYINQIPSYLVGKLHIDLFKLAKAKSFEEFVKLVRGTSYYKVLRDYQLSDPRLTNFSLCEAALVRHHYTALLQNVQKQFTGRERKSVQRLFLQEIEAYNIEVILRAKTYFSSIYNPQQLQELLLPQTYRISRNKLYELVNSPSVTGLPPPYTNMAKPVGLSAIPSPVALIAAVKSRLYHSAQRLLHLSASPMASLVAFICLAKLERENVINIVEGVRYGLKPEEIRPLLKSS